MDSKQVAELSSYYLFQNYAREALCFSHGKGEYLWDLEGNRYIDYVAGIAVNCLGHAHPELVKAICEQASRLIHVSNLYQVKEQADLGEALAAIVPAPLGRSFFCNSGQRSGNQTGPEIHVGADAGTLRIDHPAQLLPWPNTDDRNGHGSGTLSCRFCASP